MLRTGLNPGAPPPTVNPITHESRRLVVLASNILSMFRLRSVFTGVAGCPWYVNTHHEGTISSEAEAAATALQAFWQTQQATIPGPIRVDIEQTAVVIDPATGLQTGQLPVSAHSVSFSSSGAGLPHQVQALIRLGTGSYEGGRQIKGRIFVPGLITGASTGQGTLNANVITSLQAAATTLSTDSKLVIYSKKNKSATRVQTVSVWDQFATLRTRRD